MGSCDVTPGKRQCARAVRGSGSGRAPERVRTDGRSVGRRFDAMPNYCVCAGCSNSSLSGHRIHIFPDRRKHGDAFGAWVRFVQTRRRDFTAASVTKNAVVCGAHFREEDYVPGDVMELKMGFRSRDRVRLLAGAVPSIHAGELPAAAASSSSSSSSSSAVAKEEEEEVSIMIKVVGDSGSEDEGGEGAAVPGSRLRSSLRSTAVQAQPVTVSAATQTRRLPRTSSPEEIPEDVPWNREEETTRDSSEEDVPASPLSSGASDVFLVGRSQLMSLFAVCPVCCGPTRAQLRRRDGTCIKVEQVCETCGHERYWQNHWQNQEDEVMVLLINRSRKL